MRPDRLFLLDIVQSADAIVGHIRGRDQEAFFRDGTGMAAVLHELAVIGEAAARISVDTRSRHPEVPWAEIIKFRNLVIHRYFGLSWSIVWVTATADVPDLRTRAIAILQSEFPGAG